jgi:hypothetical protein
MLILQRVARSAAPHPVTVLTLRGEEVVIGSRGRHFSLSDLTEIP